MNRALTYATVYFVSPRHKACGNGMCTNQVRWIFTRLLSKEGVEW